MQLSEWIHRSFEDHHLQQDALYIKKSVLEQNVLSYALKYQV